MALVVDMLTILMAIRLENSMRQPQLGGSNSVVPMQWHRRTD